MRLRAVVAAVAAAAVAMTGLAAAGPGREMRPVARAAAVPSSVPKAACDAGDTPGEGWVLAVYVFQPGKDRYAGSVGAIRRTLWETDQTYDASARRFGTSRRIRYVQDGGCVPVVAKVAFAEGRNRAEIGDEFRKRLPSQPAAVRKIMKTGRVKLLFFVGDNEITDQCTGGGADAGLSTGGVILPLWCWSEAGLTHEFGHGMGLSHCDQDGAGGPNGSDPMCRNWGGRKSCTSDAAANYLLDSCRSDAFRYFEVTKPKGRKALPRNRNVAFSPYLIRNRPSRPVNFRLRLAGTGACVDGAGAVVLRPCRRRTVQTWQRKIDGHGYLTLRNLGTGRCLEMRTTPAAKAARVVTAACVPGRASQQWLPRQDRNGINFANRTGGPNGATLTGWGGEHWDGTPVVRGGATFVMDTAVDRGRTALSAAPSGPIRATYGTCLNADGTKVRLGKCGARWKAVPSRALGVQLRLNGRCLTLGPVADGRRTVSLAACRKGRRAQLWLFDSGENGRHLIHSATVKLLKGEAGQGDQIVLYAGDPDRKIPVHAGIPYPDPARLFRIG
ncbi:ricin-type beta-trefoil lectin domain protein [Actinocorallia longicatena]|uniref:Ricin B lectin domain-containing protein n=1 Tax=Actinocorallia longicatena TaxID=111803 RepID=A0ABP6QEA1_9ACTN